MNVIKITKELKAKLYNKQCEKGIFRCYYCGGELDFTGFKGVALYKPPETKPRAVYVCYKCHTKCHDKI